MDGRKFAQYGHPVRSVGVTKKPSGADFSYIFSGENSGENSAEIFPQKMLGKN
jgi:hypothetical protein